MPNPVVVATIDKQYIVSPLSLPQGDGLVIPFSTPASSLAKVIMQFTGELDYGGLFDDGSLLYSPMTYILFITFVILMPVLFNNLLVRVTGTNRLVYLRWVVPLLIMHSWERKHSEKFATFSRTFPLSFHHFVRTCICDSFRLYCIVV